MRDCGSLSAIAAHGPEPVEWARQDSNLGPTDYESAALTAELRARRVSVTPDAADVFPAHSWLA